MAFGRDVVAVLAAAQRALASGCASPSRADGTRPDRSRSECCRSPEDGNGPEVRESYSPSAADISARSWSSSSSPRPRAAISPASSCTGTTVSR